MNILLPLSGALGQPERVLVAREMVRPPMSLVRAQVTSTSTALAADDAVWASFPADTPRFNGASRSLLVEGQRSNLIANARTPGGTGWTFGGIDAVVAATGPDGDPESAMLVTESATSAIHRILSADISTTSGITYVVSLLVAPGTATEVQISFGSTRFGADAYANFSLSGAGAVTATGASVINPRILRSGDFYRVSMAAPCTSSGTGKIPVAFIDSPTATGSPTYLGTSRTLRLAWACVEQASFASTPVLPAIGTPAASTRGADLVSAPLASLGIGGNGACTILATVMLPQAMDGVSAQTLVQLDDGTNTNRSTFWNASGTALTLLRTSAGNNLNSATSGDFTPGIPFRIGMAIDGAGRMAASFNGSTVQSVTGAATSGLTTLRLGNTAAGNAPMFGETGLLTVLPYALSDADLAMRVAALPL